MLQYIIVHDVFTKEEMAGWKHGIQEQLARWPQVRFPTDFPD